MELDKLKIKAYEIRSLLDLLEANKEKLIRSYNQVVNEISKLTKVKEPKKKK